MSYPSLRKLTASAHTLTQVVLRSILVCTQVLSALGVSAIGMVQPSVLAPVLGDPQRAMALSGQPDPVVAGSNVITITKSVLGSTQTNYAINLIGPSYPSGTQMPMVSGTQVITGLLGGVYTITEVSPGSGWVTTYTVGASSNTSNAIVNLSNANTVSAVAPVVITGKAFSDYNSDGLITANGTVNDTGVQSVTVTIYDRNGTVAGTTTTDASGLYTITPSLSGPWRVEFSNLPAGYEPTRHGTNSDTSVQFVNSAAQASGVNFGIARPDSYSQDDPLLVVPLFSNGSGVNNTLPGLVAFPYSSSGTTAFTTVVQESQIGSSWGVGYQRTPARMFVSAFLKRQTGFKDGPGYVYTFNRNGANLSLTGSFNLQGVLPANGGAAIDLGSVCRRDNTDGNPDDSCAPLGGSASDYTLPADTDTPHVDLDAYAKIGKVSYGDIDVDEDNQTLWLVNLYQNALISVDLSGNTLPGTVRQYPLSSMGAPTCTDFDGDGSLSPTGDLHSFALKFYGGKGYVGAICDAINSRDKGDLRAFVFSFDPTNPSAGLTQILSFSLNYKLDTTAGLNSRWWAWTNTWAQSIADPSGLGGAGAISPEPILSDIEFTDDGSMVLGFMDRHAHQQGSKNYTAAVGSTTLAYVQAYGDIIKICNVNGSYVIEGTSASCPVAAKGTLTANDGVSDKGEFFIETRADSGVEAFMGALAIRSGMDEVAGTFVDPFSIFSGGLAWWDTTTPGWRTRVYEIYAPDGDGGLPYAGKGNGLGDIELLLDPAPLEIGNRVWNDVNGNGIQDPGEAGLNGVQVSLQTPTATLTTTTSGDGNYYFAVAPNTQYTISVGTPSGYSLTQANANGVSGNTAITDVRDSDAALVGITPTIYYTTGSAGQNNHGLDFGFTQPTAAQVDIVNEAPAMAQFGDRVWIENDGDGVANTGTVTPVLGLLITATNGTNVYTTTTNAQGYYSFTAPAGTYSVTYDPLPSSYGFVVPSATPLGNSTSGNLGSYQANNNTDQSRPQGSTVTLAAGEANWTMDYAFYVEPQLLPTPANVLTLTKTLVGGIGSGPFTVTVAGPDGYLTITTISANATKVITGLANGLYTVTEISPGAGWLANMTATVGTGAPAASGNPVTLSLANAITATSTLAGQITGTVYQDYNGNGAMDTNAGANTALDVGLAGVTVYAYDRNGVLQGTASSDARGIYTLTTTTSGPYRLELGALPTGYEPSFVGAQHGSGVQFANAGDIVGFAINRPSDYAQSNPPLASSFFSFTTAFADKNPPSVVSFDINTLYSTTYPDGTGAPGAGFRGPIIPSVTLASRASLGNVNGLAWQRGTRSLYAAAYARVRAASLPGTGLGPGGLGAIYRIDMSSGTPVASLFATVPNVGSYPSNSAAAIAKVGLGDVQIDDEQTLYAINVFGRALVSIPVNGVPPVAGAISQIALPQPTNCASADTFPFALGRNAGKLYIGMVCSGPALGDLRAYVYEYDGAAFVQKLSIPLNYARANVNANWDPSTPASFDLDHGFKVWDDAPTTSNGLAPMLTSIVFDHGDMVLGFRSRLADQFEQSTETIGGEILRACADSATAPTTWTLESNGVCGGKKTFATLPTSDPWSGSPNLADTTLGPDGAEFYFGDNGFEGEAVYGSLAQIPGMTGVYAAQMDAVGHRSQFGLALLSHLTGTFVSAGNVMNIVSPVNARGNYHANAMGDLEFLFDAAPLQIGNRVWEDVNGNGIQDPGEPGLNGLAVTLQTPTTTLTTLTAGDGNYAFAVAPNTPYLIKVSVPAGYNLTKVNANAVTNNHAISDVRDSDALLQTGAAVISYLTGSAGQSNHSLDIGFSKPVAAQVEIVNRAPANFGDRVWIESDGDGLANTGVLTPVSGMLITATDGVNVYTTTTNAQGYYSFTVPAGTYTVTHGDMPAAYGPVDSSTALGSATLSGSSGSYAQTGNPDQSHPQNTVLTLGAGEANWQVDFAFTPQKYDLGNRIWLDTNNDGIDNEASLGVPNVVLSLTTVIAGQWTEIATTTTDANGYYSFTSLLAGTYSVTVAPSNFAPAGALAGYWNSDPTTASSNTAGDNNLDHGVNPSTYAGYLNDGVSSGPITLGAGLPTGEDSVAPSTPNGDAQNNLTIDFGFYRQEIGNRVWYDTNGDGVDGNELPMAGVPVTLTNALGHVISTTTTNAQGYYTFTSVPSGTYIVQIEAPTGYGSTDPDGSGANVDLDDNGFGSSVGVIASPPFTMIPGTNSGVISASNSDGVTRNPSIDFGLVRSGIDVRKHTNGYNADTLADARGRLLNGQAVTWTYVIYNTGNAALSNIQLEDDRVSTAGASCAPVPLDGTLTAGQITTCTLSAVADAAQTISDVYSNTATVGGRTPGGAVLTATNLSHYEVVTPSIALRKYTNDLDADALSDPRPSLQDGQPVTWTYVMTNNGTVALSDLTLSDDRASLVNANCAPVALGGTLAVGQVTTCTLSSNAQAAAAAADGVYTNTAVVSGTPQLAILPPPDLSGFSTPPTSLVPITASNPSHYQVITPALQLTKYTIGFDADGVNDTRPLLRNGDAVTWTYVVTNVGNVALNPVVLSDDVEGAITCPQSNLAVGASMICTKVGVAQLGRVDAAGLYTNTAVVTGTPPSGPVVTSSNPSHYAVVTPSIALVKYTNGYDADTLADVRPLLREGDAVVWTYVITNTSNIALGNLTLGDDRESTVGAACAPIVLGGTLAAGGVTTCTLNGIAHVAQTSGNLYTNTATTTGTPVVPAGNPALPPLSASNPSHYEVFTPTIQVRKYTNGFDADLPSDPQPVVNLTDTVTWTFVITNSSSVSLSNITLVDDQEGNLNGRATCAPVDLGGTLLPGQTTSCTLGAAAQGGQYVNNVVAYGTPVLPPPPPSNFPLPPPPAPVTDTNPSRYYAAGPGLELRKYTNGYDADVIPFDPQPYVKVGDPVTWTYVMTNTGNVTLTNLSLNDDVLGDLNSNVGATCAPVALSGQLGIGGVTTCTLRGVANVTGQYTNTAVVTATNALSPTQQVTDSNPSHYFGSVPSIAVRKYTNGFDADGLNDPRAWLQNGDAVVWTYVITNTSNVDLQNLALGDDRVSTVGATCVPVALGGTLASGGVTTCTLPALANIGQTANGIYSNTAVVTGTPPGPLPSPTATNLSHYEVVTPSVLLVKYTNGFDADRLSDPQAQLLLNAPVIWTYFVTNTGNITLSNLTLVDDREGAITCPQSILAPRAGMLCTRLGVAGLGQYTNTAVVTGTPASNPYTPTLPVPLPPPFTPVTSTNPSHYYGFTAGLGDYVWEDIDHDGYQDVNEPGISGVTVRLLDANGAVLSTTTTNSAGYYSFTQLMPGVSYGVSFGAPAGYTGTVANADGLGVNGPRNSDADVMTGRSLPVVLGRDEFNPNIDAGFWRPSSLGDYVWRDDDMDGLQDANEVPMAGVTVNLLDANGSIIRTTTTNAQGYYSFTNLISGTYAVQFVTPSGYQPTVQTGTINDPLNSDANPITGRTQPVVLYPGDHNPNLDAGYWLPASLGDRVWNDTNANGVQDSGETGVPGVQVLLYSAVTGAPVATTTTSLTGTYLFTGLMPGDYYVGFGLPDGFVRSPQDSGSNDAQDSDANVQTGYTVFTTLTPGENDLTWDEGIYQSASLGDYVWLDRDADGVQDTDELPVQGMTVVLYENGAPVLTTTTSITGYYVFLNLKPSVPYSVSFGLPTGYTFTAPNVGGNDKIDSDANRVTGASPITILEPGEHDPTIDAGIWQAAGLGNYVWFDVDHDGVQDGGELPVAGVTVTLYRNGVAISTTTTNSAGYYSFTQLTPGVPYTLQFSLPSGYGWTLQGSNAGSDIDSNVDGNGVTAPVVLQSGEFNPTIDAGIYSSVVLDKKGVGSGPGGAIGEDKLVTFTLVVENKSNLAMTNVVISDPLSSDLEYVVGSFVPDVDEIIGQTLIWRFATIEAGGKRTMRFAARLLGDKTQTTVINTASALQHDKIVSVATTEVPFVPTAINLVRFEVVKAKQGLKVLWQTSLEQNSYGFNLYRAESERRDQAVRVTDEVISAVGRNGGARYEFVDASADVNKTYVYWLQETELSGSVYEYGPVRYTGNAIVPVAIPATNVIAGGIAIEQDTVVVVATPAPASKAQTSGNELKQGVAVLMATVTAAPMAASHIDGVRPVATQRPLVTEAQVLDVHVVPEQVALPAVRSVATQVPAVPAAPAVRAVAGVPQPRVDGVLVDKPVRLERADADAIVQTQAQSTANWPYGWLMFGLALIGVAVVVVGRRRGSDR